MSNPLYQSMMKQSAVPMNMLNMLKSNPVEFLAKRGLNISADIAGDPNRIIQQLMNSGKISQARYNSVVTAVNQFMR